MSPVLLKAFFRGFCLLRGNFLPPELIFLTCVGPYSSSPRVKQSRCFPEASFSCDILLKLMTTQANQPRKHLKKWMKKRMEIFWSVQPHWMCCPRSMCKPRCQEMSGRFQTGAFRAKRTAYERRNVSGFLHDCHTDNVRIDLPGFLTGEGECQPGPAHAYFLLQGELFLPLSTVWRPVRMYQMLFKYN